jgi:hypothetical protein
MARSMTIPAGRNKTPKIGGLPRLRFDPELLHKSGILGTSVAVIIFSGQMMGAVPLDEHVRSLRNAIIWADQRAQDQERYLSERIDPAEVYHITGHRLSASYSLCKILRMRDNQPNLYAQTYKFVHAKDAIVARLTGEFAAEPTDASGMNLFDLQAWGWSGDIIAAAALYAAKLPSLRKSADVFGGVCLRSRRKSASREAHRSYWVGMTGCARRPGRVLYNRGPRVTTSDRPRGSRWRPTNRSTTLTSAHLPGPTSSNTPTAPVARCRWRAVPTSGRASS